VLTVEVVESTGNEKINLLGIRAKELSFLSEKLQAADKMKINKKR